MGGASIYDVLTKGAWDCLHKKTDLSTVGTLREYATMDVIVGRPLPKRALDLRALSVS